MVHTGLLLLLLDRHLQHQLLKIRAYPRKCTRSNQIQSTATAVGRSSSHLFEAMSSTVVGECHQTKQMCLAQLYTVHLDICNVNTPLDRWGATEGRLYPRVFDGFGSGYWDWSSNVSGGWEVRISSR